MRRGLAQRAFKARAYRPRALAGVVDVTYPEPVWTRRDPRDVTHRGYVSVAPPMPRDVTHPGIIGTDLEDGI